MRLTTVRRLACSIIVVALASCTDSGIRSDVSDTFDAQDDDVVEGVCDTIVNLAGGSPRDAFEQDLESIPDAGLETFGPVDGPGVPDSVRSYDGAEIREWLVATWDECDARGKL